MCNFDGSPSHSTLAHGIALNQKRSPEIVSRLTGAIVSIASLSGR
jgi:hypothetical protein